MAARNQEFQAVRSEGGLLPADLLRRVLDPRSKLAGTSPQDYGLLPGDRLNEVITQAWNQLRRHWEDFRAQAANLPADEAGTGLTNERWNLPLLRQLGFGMLPVSAGPEIDGKTYAIARFAGAVPVHLIGCGLSLDRRTAGQRGAAAGNPHGLVQEFLNRSDANLWAVISNGLRLRLLRDNQALSRQSFVEFDLEAIFSGELYGDFVLLWLVCHATHLLPRDGAAPESCWLERWTREAEEQGTRALRELRSGVERALQVLGEGFTSHPRNTALRESLRDGSITPGQLHSQLLRLVYRFIFLFVAEDRTLDGRSLLHPIDDSPAGRTARERYAAHYSTARLRALAGTIKGSRHGDLWRQCQLLVTALSGEPAGATLRAQLALPALGSFLWSAEATAALNAAELTNFDLLEALRHLAYTRQGKLLRPVDYKNLGAEELGGVYESLLALTPQISADGARFSFAEFAGNERKTSGSYYTPDSLVQCLLDSALDPVVEAAIKGKRPAEAEQAILQLKVCDPAVGSGHFLVGAAHRLARHLARARALGLGESEPSPLLYQHALRDVISRCLYGVDVNPMSAELCRVSLWLEALEPGKPLAFLDHHIRVGNSLMGATPALIAAGIPDEAFSPIEGDDKKACSALKKRNKAERKGIGPLFAEEAAEIEQRLQQAAAALEELPDARPEDIKAKALAFRQHEHTADYRRRKALADLWCAAFVIPKTFIRPGDESTATGITQRHLNLLADADLADEALLAQVDALTAQYQFFHWHLAFPEVAARGGFDCMLGNPPWERVKLQEKEWFAERVAEIATAQSADARGRLIKRLQAERPELHALFLADVRLAEGASTFLRGSGRYPLCGRGDVNLYTVFSEAMRDGVSPTGRVGCIVPSGIATDDTTKFFFQDLVDRASLVSLFDFENAAPLFEGVHRSYKFACVALRAPAADEQAAAKATPAEFVFFAHRVEDLADDNRRFTLTRDEIALVNPNTRTCPIFRTKVDAELTKYIYRRVPVLVDENKPDGNPWGVQFSTMFHMSNDSHLFRTREELERDGWTLRGNVFERGAEQCLPLYEAKMAQVWDHRAADVVKSPTATVRQNQPAAIPLEERRDPCRLATPFYWVSEPKVRAAFGGACPSANVMVTKVTSATNARTCSPTILPPAAYGDSVLLLLTSRFDMPALATAQLGGALSSFALDYVARQKLGGVNLNFYIQAQLPVPSPSHFGVGSDRSLLLQSLLSRILELSATADDMSPFSKDLWPEGDGAVFRYDPERRFEIRCELDAAFFHLYLGTPEEWSRTASPELLKSLPTPRDAVAYIMETFPIVKRNDEEAYGSYRTKERILALYDELTRCLAEGREFTSTLHPPPGPPTTPDGRFAPLPAWPSGAPMPSDWPAHVHLPPHAAASADLVLQLADLAREFPASTFRLRVGGAARLRVTPVAATQLASNQQVVIASPRLTRSGAPVPVAMGSLRVEARLDASNDRPYHWVTVTSEEGVAQARFAEDEWRSLSTVGLINESPEA